MNDIIRTMDSSHKSLLVLRCKTLIIGDAGVGKTSVTQMFHSGGHAFPKNYIMTAGVDFCVKSVNIPETTAAVELYLFDCGGQSIFNQREYGTVHYQNASMVILTYDVSNRESFKSCAKWYQEVNHVTKKVTGVLLATKTDLREGNRDAVSQKEGEEFAEEYNLKYFESSAQRGEQVDAPFNYIAHAFYRKYEDSIQKAEKAN